MWMFSVLQRTLELQFMCTYQKPGENGAWTWSRESRYASRRRTTKKTKEEMKLPNPAELGIRLLENGITSADFLKIKMEEFNLDERDAFIVADMGDIVHKHLRWHEALPRVAPFYAVKCNDRRAVISTLACLGAGFDCASKNEINMVLNQGVPAERIIFANPCKQSSDIREAAVHGVHTMTFDCEDELVKVSQINPTARLVLRIAADDPSALFKFGNKFGASLEDSKHLLHMAKKLGLEIIGVSFHVGSGSKEPEAYVKAIYSSHDVFHLAKKLGFSMKLLDIGGGFPGCDNDGPKFEEFAARLKPALDLKFPRGSGVSIIAEPGTFYVMSALTLVATITTKKVHIKDDDKRIMKYYLDDGLYGSFCTHLYDPEVVMKPISFKGSDEPMFESICMGPTGDEKDCIISTCSLPEQSSGDWLHFKDMGAYTVSTYTSFGGFTPSHCEDVIGQDDWQTLQTLPEDLRTLVPVDATGLSVPLSCCVQNS
uniref:ornithine decarboxylase n=1 Tax=Eptatretus burgeri TaxID=7764 RepID=A0A8C4QY68_EPTBU